jgi:hypothetical protein
MEGAMKRNFYVSIVLVLFSIFLVGAESAAVCLDPPPGMVSWWPGDGHALDIIGPNHGTLQNGASFAPGKVDQAFSFDGVDDLVGASGTGIDDLQQLTIDAWVKHNSLPPRMIQRYVTLIGEKAVLRYDEGLHFYMKIDGSLHHILVNDVLQDEFFHHLAGIYDGSFMRLYSDGVEVGSLEVSGAVGSGTGVVLGDGEPFFGLLDEVEIYDRALSALEIQAIYDAGSEGKCKPTVPEYYIGYLYVQHREYEDGTSLNRLYFEVKDKNGQYIPSPDPIANAELYDPNGNLVNLGPFSFSAADYYPGWYDGDNGQWIYNPIVSYTEFTSDILDSLIVGTYHLVVTTDGGDTLEADFEFFGQVSLPIISSNTFEVNLYSGHLLWEWEITPAVYGLSFNYETSARAIITIYNNQQYVGFAYFKVPTHMEKILVPPNIVQDIISRGNRFDFIMQIRTNDNNNRSYSNPFTLP